MLCVLVALWKGTYADPVVVAFLLMSPSVSAVRGPRTDSKVAVNEVAGLDWTVLVNASGV